MFRIYTHTHTHNKCCCPLRKWTNSQIDRHGQAICTIRVPSDPPLGSPIHRTQSPPYPFLSPARTIIRPWWSLYTLKGAFVIRNPWSIGENEPVNAVTGMTHSLPNGDKDLWQNGSATFVSHSRRDFPMAKHSIFGKPTRKHKVFSYMEGRSWRKITKELFLNHFKNLCFLERESLFIPLW